MGLCGSTQSPEFKESLANSKKLEQINRADNRKDEQRVKLLLLGAGESGKSTIFKQMKILYGADGGYTHKEREQAKAYVYSNVYTNMRTVIENSDRFEKLKDAEAEKAFMDIATSGEDSSPVVDKSSAEIIKRVWNDDGFQKTWHERAEFQVQDALEYYVKEIDRISEDDYIPTEADILRSRVRTTGIQEETYYIDAVEFVMFDVGGQRNERKKWIHCFDQVTAVIFVAAISEYNQVLYEDNTMNRIDEAVTLFNEICNSKWFKKTAMILFLNKRDLFRTKLPEYPFSTEERYSDFKGPHCVPGEASAQDGTDEFEACYDAASKYLLQLFLDQNKQSKEI